MFEAERALLAQAEQQYGVGARRAGDAVHPWMHGIEQLLLDAEGACMWLGEHAAISHLTAATLLRLDGCRTTELHASVGLFVRARQRHGIHLHRVAALDPIDRITVD